MMNCPCEPDYRPVCVLVHRVLDTMRTQGRGCTAKLDACLDPCSCLQLGCGQVLCGATLRDVCLENAPGRLGCCLKATLVIPVRIEVFADGCRRVIASEICVPVSGILRSGCGQPSDYLAQVEACIRDVCFKGRDLCVVFDYCAAIYAVCLTPVRIPILPDCKPRCDCSQVFSLPLYPGAPPLPPRPCC